MEKTIKLKLFIITFVLFSLLFTDNILAQEKKLKSIEVYAISYTMNKENGEIKSFFDVVDEAKKDSSFQIITDTIVLGYLYKSKIQNVKPKKRKIENGSDRIFILYNYVDNTFERFILNSFINDVTIVPKGSIDTSSQIYSYKLKKTYWKDLLKYIANKKLNFELKRYMQVNGIK